MHTSTLSGLLGVFKATGKAIVSNPDGSLVVAGDIAEFARINTCSSAGCQTTIERTGRIFWDLAQLTRDGVLNGSQPQEFGEGPSKVSAIRHDSQGRIVVAARSPPGLLERYLLVRFLQSH